MRVLKVNNNLLTIGYSVLADRVENIQLPKFLSMPNIFISIQNPKNISYKLPEIVGLGHIEQINSGVAKSRNEVLRAAKSKYLIFADDDITFHEENIKAAISYLEANPKCDLVLGTTIDESGNFRKKYPEQRLELTRFNSGKAATYEIIVRVETFHTKNLFFDENFGAGVENFLGDEYILIADLIKLGGRGVFLPLIFATHPTDSSGSNWAKSENLKARAAVFKRVFGFWAILVRAAFIFRPGRIKVSFIKRVRFIFGL